MRRRRRPARPLNQLRLLHVCRHALRGRGPLERVSLPWLAGQLLSHTAADEDALLLASRLFEILPQALVQARVVWVARVAARVDDAVKAAVDNVEGTQRDTVRAQCELVGTERGEREREQADHEQERAAPDAQAAAASEPDP